MTIDNTKINFVATAPELQEQWNEESKRNCYKVNFYISNQEHYSDVLNEIVQACSEAGVGILKQGKNPNSEGLVPIYFMARVDSPYEFEHPLQKAIEVIEKLSNKGLISIDDAQQSKESIESQIKIIENKRIDGVVIKYNEQGKSYYHFPGFEHTDPDQHLEEQQNQKPKTTQPEEPKIPSPRGHHAPTREGLPRKESANEVLKRLGIPQNQGGRGIGGGDTPITA